MLQCFFLFHSQLPILPHPIYSTVSVIKLYLLNDADKFMYFFSLWIPKFILLFARLTWYRIHCELSMGDMGVVYFQKNFSEDLFTLWGVHRTPNLVSVMLDYGDFSRGLKVFTFEHLVLRCYLSSIQKSGKFWGCITILDLGLIWILKRKTQDPFLLFFLFIKEFALSSLALNIVCLLFCLVFHC